MKYSVDSRNTQPSATAQTRYLYLPLSSTIKLYSYHRLLTIVRIKEIQRSKIDRHDIQRYSYNPNFLFVSFIQSRIMLHSYAMDNLLLNSLFLGLLQLRRTVRSHPRLPPLTHRRRLLQASFLDDTAALEDRTGFDWGEYRVVVEGAEVEHPKSFKATLV